MWRTPLVVALVMMPVRNERIAGRSGPNYVDRKTMEARNRARAFLEAHFEIVAKPVTEVGWVLGAENQLSL